MNVKKQKEIRILLFYMDGVQKYGWSAEYGWNPEIWMESRNIDGVQKYGWNPEITFFLIF